MIARYIAVGGITISRYYESAIARLLNGTCLVIATPTERFFPFYCSCLREFYNPIVVIAMVPCDITVRGFAMSSDNESAIVRLLN